MVYMSDIFRSIRDDLNSLIYSKDSLSDLYEASANICDWFSETSNFKDDKINLEFFSFLLSCPNNSIYSILSEIYLSDFSFNLFPVRKHFESFLSSKNSDVVKFATFCLLNSCGEYGKNLVEEHLSNKDVEYAFLIWRDNDS